MKRLLREVSKRIRYRRARAVLGGLCWRMGKRAEYWRAVRRSASGAVPPVIIYQMAKVGSTTIASALKRIDGLSVFHIHFMHPDNVRRVRSFMRDKGLARFQSDIDILGQALFRGIIKAGRKAKIITLVREPVGRNISFYFQTLDLLWRTLDAHDRVELGRLVDEFPDRFNQRSSLNWFDTEFKPVLGIDVYQHPFPHDAGHLRIDGGRFDVLIMRSDLEDSVKAKCLEEFLGVEGVSLVARNVGAQKPYAATYRKFLQAVELEEGYVDELLGSKYTRHFFTLEEIARLREKWLGRGGA